MAKPGRTIGAHTARPHKLPSGSMKYVLIYNPESCADIHEHLMTADSPSADLIAGLRMLIRDNESEIIQAIVHELKEQTQEFKRLLSGITVQPTGEIEVSEEVKPDIAKYQERFLA